MNQKILQNLLKSLCWSPFLISCKPRAYNCIKIDSLVQPFSSGFCEINNSLKQLLNDLAKTVSVRNFTETL